MPAIHSGKVLVTGASGYIAVWVLKALLDRGFSVRVTVRSESKRAVLKEVFKTYGARLECVIVEDVAKVSPPFLPRNGMALTIESRGRKARSTELWSASTRSRTPPRPSIWTRTTQTRSSSPLYKAPLISSRPPRSTAAWYSASPSRPHVRQSRRPGWKARRSTSATGTIGRFARRARRVAQRTHSTSIGEQDAIRAGRVGLVRGQERRDRMGHGGTEPIVRPGAVVAQDGTH